MNKIQNVLFKLVNPVTIITANHKGKSSGFIGTWVTQVSFAPPLIMAAVNPRHYTYELVKSSGAFAVNILGSDQVTLVDSFGKRSGKTVNKFENIEYEFGITNSPILRNCVAYFDCRVVWEREAGDHQIVIGSIVDANIRSGAEALIESPSMYKTHG
jgi:flavin reductase (DIM6/NTAB) family NADH-FMN oxidoreductase RutF